MSVTKKLPLAERSYLLSTSNPSAQLIENADDDSQARVTFLRQLHIKPNSRTTSMNSSSLNSVPDRTPSSLLELKQQRLVAADDRRKRLITRIISVVGLLIILLCAVIVTLTLKMAPKIDELVRTKTGSYQLIHLISRMSTPSTTTTTIVLNNSTTNSSLLEKFTLRLRRKI